MVSVGELRAVLHRTLRGCPLRGQRGDVAFIASRCLGGCRVVI